MSPPGIDPPARILITKIGLDDHDRGQPLNEFGRAAASHDANGFEAAVDGAGAGLTHGEICAKLREIYGFGNPLIIP